MGYTHVELLPVAEHPLDASWGYQVTGYYAPTSRFGTPEDFMYFVDRCHQSNIAVILDWVPAHFPKDGHGLNYFDGTHLYSHEDPRQGEHPDWGTMIFNYARNEVRNFLLANALFLAETIPHRRPARRRRVFDDLPQLLPRGRRLDRPTNMAATRIWARWRFLREFNELVHAEAPGAVTIAEESTSWAMVSHPTYVGGLGFTLKWNMGWMHDTLEYMHNDPVHRRFHHHQITFASLYAFSENFVLPLSHDEVVHMKGSLIGKMPGDYWQKFAGLRLLFGYQYTQVGKVLNFMGNEIAQFSRMERSAQPRLAPARLRKTRADARLGRVDLNHFLPRSSRRFGKSTSSPAAFRWIEANDADNSVYSYIRLRRRQRRLPHHRAELHAGRARGLSYRRACRRLLPRGAEQRCRGSTAAAMSAILGGVNSEDILKPRLDPSSVSLRLPPLAMR